MLLTTRLPAEEVCVKRCLSLSGQGAWTGTGEWLLKLVCDESPPDRNWLNEGHLCQAAVGLGSVEEEKERRWGSWELAPVLLP